MSKKRRPKPPSPASPDLHPASAPVPVPSEKETSSPENLAQSRFLGIISLVIVFLAFFGRLLISRVDLIFRDAGGFYYPLFEFIQTQWNQGLIPLWNPYENAGVPLIAMGTSSIFYPLKLLFFLPLPYDILFKSYLLLHVLLACLTMTWLSRRWNLSWLPTIAATMTFVFSAPFLFQLYNVVFLVSAAWLPLGVYFGESLIRQLQLSSLLGLAFTLAMMVLGGDPQTAYHLGIILGVFALLAPRTDDSSTKTTSPIITPSTWAIWSKRLTLRLASLAAAAAIAGLLSAIQLLPTSEFSRQTDRASSEVPTNLWQVPGFLASSGTPSERYDTGQLPHWFDTLIGDPPAPAKHYLQIYAFSFSPFRLPEFFFPNVTGSNVNENSRWLNTLDLEDSNLWHTSSYFGLLPVSLVLLSFFLRQLPLRARWFQIVIVLSLLASLGRFGPLSLLDVFKGQFHGNPTGETANFSAREVGGLYWFLTILLPGYNLFRFPEKWIVILTFSSAMLAGMMLQERRLFLEKTLKSLRPFWLVTIGVAWAILFLTTPNWATLLRPNDPQSLFSLGKAWLAVFRGILHATVIALILGNLSFLCRRLSNKPASPQTLMIALLVVLSVDLVTANSRWILPVSHNLWNHRPDLAKLIEASQRDTPNENSSPLPPRYFRDLMFSASLKNISQELDTATRLLTALRAVGGGYASLDMEMCNIATRSTMDISAYTTFFDILPMPDGTIINPRRSLDAWGAQYFVLPEFNDDKNLSLSTQALTRQWLPGGPSSEPVHYLPTGPLLPQALPNASQLFPVLDTVQVLKNISAYPHAWVVRDLKLIPPIDDKDRSRWVPLMQEIVYPGGVGYDLSKTAIVETNLTELSPPDQLQSSTTPTPAEDTFELTSYTCQQIRLNAQLKQPGLLVIADTFYPGWKAYASTSDSPDIEIPIQRVNRMMRGLYLPAGTFHLRFQYEPTSFWTGLTISSVAWLLLLVTLTSISTRRFLRAESHLLNDATS